MEKIITVSKQTSWQIFAKITTALSTFIILALVTRHFGETGTGIYTLALTYLAFFYIIGDFGLNAVILPKLLVNPDVFWRKLLGLRIFFAFTLITIAIALISIWPSGETQFKEAVVVGSSAILASAIFVTSNVFFQSKLRYDLSFIAVALGSALTLATTLIILQNNFPIPYLMIGHVVGWFAIATASLVLVSKFTSISPVLDSSFIKNTFLISWPVSATLVLNVVYFRIDAFLLSFLKSFSDVGVYNLAYSIFQTLLVLPTFIINSFYPMMIKEYTEDKDRFSNTLVKASFLMLILALLVTSFVFFSSPFILKALAGSEGFFGSVATLQILSLFFPAYFLSALWMWSLVTIKKYKLMLVVYIVGLLLNILLNMLLIPDYSYIGSAWATGISEYLILIFLFIIIFKELKRK